MKIFVVEGRTGEYSDRSEWLVCAYADQTKAETHATLANAWLHERRAHTETPHALSYDDRRSLGPNPYDPDGEEPDYTGSDYRVHAIELRDEVPAIEVKG